MSKHCVILERNGPRGGWRVVYGERVVCVGNRVTCKRLATQFCNDEGIRAWWHQKKGTKRTPGKCVAIKLTHGARRSLKAKKRAVKALLKDPNVHARINGDIATVLGLDFLK